MKIGIDLDGVLCNFVRSYAGLLTSLTGKPVSEIASCWDWVRQEGITPEEEQEAWRVIGSDRWWWTGVEADPSVRFGLHGLEDLTREIYFITDRRTPGAKRASEHWLRLRGVITPTVLITPTKGMVAAALGLDAFIDDKPEHCVDVTRASEATQVFLRQAPYNEADVQRLREAHGVTPVRDVWEMLLKLELPGYEP